MPNRKFAERSQMEKGINMQALFNFFVETLQNIVLTMLMVPRRMTVKTLDWTWALSLAFLNLPIVGLKKMYSTLTHFADRLWSYFIDTFFYYTGEIITFTCTVILFIICGLLFWTLSIYSSLYTSLVGSPKVFKKKLVQK